MHDSKAGWPKGRFAHEGHVNRTNQSWTRSDVKERYQACDRDTGKEIWVNVLGQAFCNECFEIAYSDHRGFTACKCTVWNDGKPRPENTNPEKHRMRGMHRFFKAIA
jgi:hypothetical protein